MHVCVIGAGPSGLVSARELTKEGHSVVVLEQNHDVGGQWLYSDPAAAAGQVADCSELVGAMAEGRAVDPSTVVHSSVYDSLRLLFPREAVGFTDFPFVAKKGRDTRRFPGHREVHLYLKDFCQRFGLRELIRFNTRVVYVGMVDPSADHKSWVVRSMAEEADERDKVLEEVFDAVVIATGHHSQPAMPNFNGNDKWRRKQLHSHLYRVPEPFRNEVVVVVGNGFSGQDISLELVNVAKEVHLSVKSPKITPGLSTVVSKYHNLHLHPQIDSLFEDGRVLFNDGSSIFADTIIYCTGYSYSFPFLDTKGVISIDDGRVGPLYEHTFPPSLAPSLSFVGIPAKIIGFPFFESQAKWIAQLLSAKRRLPSCDDMMKATEEFYRYRDAKGIPKHKTHDIADLEYCNKYGDNCDFPHMEKWRRELCIRALRDGRNDLETYRDRWDGDQVASKGCTKAIR